MSVWYQRLTLAQEPNPGALSPNVLRRANIGEDYWDASLDFIPDRFPYKDEVEGYINFMHEWDRIGMGMMLSGPYGTGKTAIGCIVLREALMRRASCYAIRCSTMVNRLWDKKQTILKNGAPLRVALENVHYLFIDDFEIFGSRPGETRSNKDLEVEEIIKSRTENRLPTIIATNVEWTVLLDLGYLNSQVHKWFWPYNITGIDWRKKPPVPQTAT